MALPMPLGMVGGLPAPPDALGAPTPGLGAAGLQWDPTGGAAPAGLAQQPTPDPFSAQPQAPSPRAAGVTITGDQAYGGGAGSQDAMAQIDQIFDNYSPPEDAPAPVAGPTALQGAAAGTSAERQNILEFLAANPKRTISKANVERPLVEATAQRFRGGGPLQVPAFEPQPYAGVPRNEGETDEEYAARNQFFADVDLQQQQEAYQLQVQEAQAQAGELGDVRDIGEQGHLGEAEAQLQAAEDVGGAQVEQQQAVADTMREASALQRDATAQARAQDEERRDFANTQREAITTLQRTETDAREKLRAMPDLDPQRFFKSMSGGNKFFALLGAVAGGAIGIDFVGKMQGMAQQDLEAQKAQFGQQQARVGEAEGAVQEASGLYQDLLRSAGDEQVADSMWLKLQLEDAAGMLESELADTTVPLMKAQIQEHLVGLQQAIGVEGDKIDRAMATTPHTVHTRVDPLGRGTRRDLMKRAETLDERGFEFQKLGVKSEEAGFEREGRIEEKRATAEGAVKVKRVEAQVKAEQQIKDRTAAWGQTETMIDEFLTKRPGEMFSVGIPGMGDKDQRVTEEAFFDLLPELVIAAFTGAAADDDQRAAAMRLVHGDWSDFGDEDRRARLMALKDMAGTQRRFLQQQIKSERAGVERASDLPSFTPR